MSKKFSETIVFKKIDNNTLQIHAEETEAIGIILLILTANFDFLDEKFPDGNIDDIMDYLG